MTEALQRLCRDNHLAKAFLSLANGSDGTSRASTFNDFHRTLSSDGYMLGHDESLDLMRELESAGAGVLHDADQPHSARIEWKPDLATVAALALGVPARQAQVTSHPNGYDASPALAPQPTSLNPAGRESGKFNLPSGASIEIRLAGTVRADDREAFLDGVLGWLAQRLLSSPAEAEVTLVDEPDDEDVESQAEIDDSAARVADQPFEALTEPLEQEVDSLGELAHLVIARARKRGPHSASLLTPSNSLRASKMLLSELFQPVTCVSREASQLGGFNGKSL